MNIIKMHVNWTFHGCTSYTLWTDEPTNNCYSYQVLARTHRGGPRSTLTRLPTPEPLIDMPVYLPLERHNPQQTIDRLLKLQLLE